MPRMYHPAHGGVEDVPDDDGCVAVLKESGWLIAPDPEPVAPGIVPEPVTFAPVAAPQPDPEAKAKRPKPTTASTDGD